MDFLFVIELNMMEILQHTIIEKYLKFLILTELGIFIVIQEKLLITVFCILLKIIH